MIGLLPIKSYSNGSVFGKRIPFSQLFEQFISEAGNIFLSEGYEREDGVVDTFDNKKDVELYLMKEKYLYVGSMAYQQLKSLMILNVDYERLESTPWFRDVKASDKNANIDLILDSIQGSGSNDIEEKNIKNFNLINTVIARVAEINNDIRLENSEIKRGKKGLILYPNINIIYGVLEKLINKTQNILSKNYNTTEDLNENYIPEDLKSKEPLVRLSDSQMEMVRNIIKKNNQYQSTKYSKEKRLKNFQLIRMVQDYLWIANHIDANMNLPLIVHDTKNGGLIGEVIRIYNIYRDSAIFDSVFDIETLVTNEEIPVQIDKRLQDVINKKTSNFSTVYFDMLIFFGGIIRSTVRKEDPWTNENIKIAKLYIERFKKFSKWMNDGSLSTVFKHIQSIIPVVNNKREIVGLPLTRTAIFDMLEIKKQNERLIIMSALISPIQEAVSPHYMLQKQINNIMGDDSVPESDKQEYSSLIVSQMTIDEAEEYKVRFNISERQYRQNRQEQLENYKEFFTESLTLVYENILTGNLPSLPKLDTLEEAEKIANDKGIIYLDSNEDLNKMSKIFNIPEINGDYKLPTKLGKYIFPISEMEIEKLGRNENKKKHLEAHHLTSLTITLPNKKKVKPYNILTMLGIEYEDTEISISRGRSSISAVKAI